MLVRSLVFLAVLLGVSAAVWLWQRPPRRRLGRLDLADLGLVGPAIVQFSAPACAPCQAAVPRLEDAARRTGIPYARVDVGDRPEVVRRYGIRTVPTTVVARATGEVTGVWTGVPNGDRVAEAALLTTAPSGP